MKEISVVTCAAEQHAIGERIRRRRVALDRPAAFARHELLFLELAARRRRAPPPLIMHVRHVRRVHQADDGVVHARRENAVDDEFRFAEIAEIELRRGRRRRCRARDRRRRTRARCRWLRASENGARGCGLLRRAGLPPARGLACTRRPSCRSASRDTGTRPSAAPFVADNAASRKRHGAVRTDVAQRERAPLFVAAQHHRLAQNFAAKHLPALQARARSPRSTRDP